MNLDIELGYEILKQIERRDDATDEELHRVMDKKWVSVESLRAFIISDQRNKFREAILNDYGQVKSTMEKLLWELKE